MINDFDQLIDRSGTHSVKYDLRKVIFGRSDVIPMWVADMDFAVPPFVQEAIRKRADHPVFGYTIFPGSYFAAIKDWQKKRHQWHVEKDWIRFSPGVVTGLNMIIQGLTDPGDKIIVQPPVYFPFFTCVTNNGRELLQNQLKEENGNYYFDFKDLEHKMASGAKMLILCNPHNPVGRCWTREELEWIGAKSIEHKVLVVSDEIHCDLVMPSYRYIPFATLSEAIAENTITCIAPSKTFNLAGLFTSSIIISNEELKSKFMLQEERMHLNPNIFGLVASEAAYRYGESWRLELVQYLSGNYRLVKDFLETYMPEVGISPLEATYLAWMDFRKWNIPHEKLTRMLVEQAGVGLGEGGQFGAGGEGFQRMNIGCPRAIVQEALVRIFSLRKSLGAF